MRIAYFVPRCTPENSHGRYVIELAKRFSQESSVTIYSGAIWEPLRSIVRCRLLPVPNRPAVARLAALWSTSIAVFARRSADIVHVQGADAPVANVVTAQCCTAAMRASGARGGSLHRRFNFALGAVGERYCMGKASTRRVIAVSPKVKREIEDIYHIDPANAIVVPLGVDPEDFHPRQRDRWRESIRASFRIKPDKFVVIFVGGDFRRKGLMELVRAASTLRSFHVLAVGVRPDVALNQVLEREGLQQDFTFTEPVEEIAPLYAAADAFALLTRYDTFSMATIEAMATGLPVVVSREAGVTEYLNNGVDSYLLPNCTDVEGLTRAIDLLMREVPFRDSLGAAARSTAERFSWNSIATQTMAVYRQVA